jgi:hypothetical protein
MNDIVRKRRMMPNKTFIVMFPTNGEIKVVGCECYDFQLGTTSGLRPFCCTEDEV